MQKTERRQLKFGSAGPPASALVLSLFCCVRSSGESLKAFLAALGLGWESAWYAETALPSFLPPFRVSSGDVYLGWPRLEGL